MNAKIQKNVYFKFNQMEEQIKKLEKQLEDFKGETEKAFTVLQSHLARVKNGETLSDDFIVNRMLYNDLSPEAAFRLFNDKDNNFILLDVSRADFQPPSELPEAFKIPLEDLGARHMELENKKARIYIISEDGTRSILACALLNELGFFNLNNISGGYKFWPGFRSEQDSHSETDEQLRSA